MSHCHLSSGTSVYKVSRFRIIMFFVWRKKWFKQRLLCLDYMSQGCTIILLLLSFHRWLPNQKHCLGQPTGWACDRSVAIIIDLVCCLFVCSFVDRSLVVHGQQRHGYGEPQEERHKGLQQRHAVDLVATEYLLAVLKKSWRLASCYRTKQFWLFVASQLRKVVIVVAMKLHAVWHKSCSQIFWDVLELVIN